MIITFEQLYTFFLIFARIAGLVLYAPVFSSKEIMPLAKFVIIFWMSAILIFVVPLPQVFPDAGISYALALTAEVLIGAIIGFSTQILISGIVLAGSLIDTQTAMGVASAFDPAVGVATTLFSKLLRYIIIIIFLIFDGHHMLLSAIYQSFKLLPLASPVHLDNAALVLVQLGTDIFRIGVLLAAPCLLVLFLLDFAFGIVTRVAPDINIFALAMQFKPLANLFVFLAILPIMVRNLFTILERVAEYILKIFLALQM